MSNICINSITFTSKNPQLLMDLQKHIQSIANDKARNSIVNLLKSYEYTDAEILIIADRRDYISDCNNTIDQKLNIYMFSCETCTAWDENITPWLSLLKKVYKNQINIYFQSEEDSDSLYTYHDPTGVFYRDRFKADFCINDNYCTEYFHEYHEMIDYLDKYFPDAEVNVFMSLTDVEEAIKDKYEDKGGEDFFISLNMFVPFDMTDYKRYEEVA